MKRTTEKGKYIVFTILTIVLLTILKCNVYAVETNEKIVRIGYYENENRKETQKQRT